MAERKKPNVIVVYTDQQRYDTIGANGNDLIRTPNLDRLAREGVNFSRAYVTTPVCVPSRASFFTGRYAHSSLSYNNSRLLFERETDMANWLRQHGYRTGLVGKDHCFPKDRREVAFDWTRLAGHTGFNPPLDEVEERVGRERSDKMQVPMADDPIPAADNITARLFRSAGDFIDTCSDDPFFLWLSIPDPHPPYMVCEPYASMYDDVDMPPPAWTDNEMANKPHRQQLVVEWNRYDREYPGGAIDELRRIYWGMVSCIDAELGRFLEVLRQRGLEEDTIIVFTADHGDYMGDHRMIRKGPHLYEALTHVPLIVRWPGHFPARQTSAMAANIDLFPTLCELADAPTPEAVQGESFAAVLRGQANSYRPLVFMEHGDPGQALQPGDLSPAQAKELGDGTGHHLCREICRGRSKAVRGERWKYCTTAGDVDELYDLENDPHELCNLATDPAYANVVREYRDHLLDWLVATEDTMAGGNPQQP